MKTLSPNSRLKKRELLAISTSRCMRVVEAVERIDLACFEEEVGEPRNRVDATRPPTSDAERRRRAAVAADVGSTAKRRAQRPQRQRVVALGQPDREVDRAASASAPATARAKASRPTVKSARRSGRDGISSARRKLVVVSSAGEPVIALAVRHAWPLCSDEAWPSWPKSPMPSRCRARSARRRRRCGRCGSRRNACGCRRRCSPASARCAETASSPTSNRSAETAGTSRDRMTALRPILAPSIRRKTL